MKVGIMQPYFLPYIGYFQLIAAVDTFVVYDNIKYTKKGWINRNRMLLNGCDVTFSLPLRKDSDSLDVAKRGLASNFDRTKLLNKFTAAYRQAPQFGQTLPVLEQIIGYQDTNLFRYIYHSIVRLCEYLEIKTSIKISSGVPIDSTVNGKDRVIALCKAVSANTYINAFGGVELYSKSDFLSKGIELQFIKALPFEYLQFDAPFVPWLSIIDVLMFNPVNAVQACINENYELV